MEREDVFSLILFSFLDMKIKQSCLHMESLETKEIRINNFSPNDPSNHWSEKRMPAVIIEC